MANKDGVVSIGFDYKKELDEVCTTIEKEINNLGGDINLSDGIKKQMIEIKRMITDMKKDIGSSFDKITETKLDTKTFEAFKKDVNKKIREINNEVTTLKEQFSVLGNSANVDGIIQQFANLKKYVEDSNSSISELISNSKKLEQSIKLKNEPSDSKENINDIKKQIDSLERSLNVLDGNGMTSYKNKSIEKLKEDIIDLVASFDNVQNQYEVLSETLKSSNKSSPLFTSLKNQAVEYELKLAEILTRIETIRNEIDNKGLEKYEKQLEDYNNRKIVKTKSDGSVEYAKEPNYPTPIDLSDIIPLDIDEKIDDLIDNGFESGVGKAKALLSELKTDLNSISDKPEKPELNGISNNIELHISTKQSTINKQLDEMIDMLQQRAASKPIIAPIKLRVDSEYEKSTKDSSTSALTENQIREARKDVEGVVPGLEKAFNNSMRIATNKAIDNANEAIKSIRKIFEENPIAVHLTIPEEEKEKIDKVILSEDGNSTIDISGQINKARESVKGLSEDLEKSQLLIKENAKNAKNLSLEKLVNSLSDTMAQFSELKEIIVSIQNMENTIARASGISSTNELMEQWNIVEKSIINATKLDGNFRKNTNIGTIVSEYQKYLNMGGTNTLSGIDKIKDNEATINSILSKIKDLKTQDIENDSVQKLSVDLDGVISKFDELIAVIKSTTDALYNVVSQGNVSDLDKQWDSISKKFKSIADETGKINLNKQKSDIKELVGMYQNYESSGGTNPFSYLTDNADTVRKLSKEYQKLNDAQALDNSSTVKSESEAFKGVEKSVNSLITAIGDTKVQAINTEATAMEDAASREVVAIKTILDSLDLIVNRLNAIKDINLPTIKIENQTNVSSDNISSVAKINETEKIITENLRLNESYYSEKEKREKEYQQLRAKYLADGKKQEEQYYTDLEKANQEYINDYSRLLDERDKKTETMRSSMQSTLDTYQGKLLNLFNNPDNAHRLPEYQTRLDNLNRAIQEYKTFIDSLQGKDFINDDDIGKSEKLKSNIEKLFKEIKGLSFGDKGYTDIGADNVLEKINRILEQNTRMSQKARAQIKAFYNEIMSGKPTRPLKEILDDVYKIVQAEREAGRVGRSWLDIFNTKKLHSFLGQAASMFSFYDIINLGKDGFNTIRELDTALTEMRKVSDESVESLKNYQATTFDIAGTVGTTAKTIQNSTADWMRLGESMDDAAESAEVSNILLNVSEFDNIDSATESLVSMSQAYKELEKIDIVDVLNNIGNNYSISTDGLATALQKSASALKTANNDLNEAVALTTAGNAIAQDPDSVGAGLRTISLRLVGTEAAKNELESLGEETDDVITTTSKLRDTILSATKAATDDGKGFDILDSNGNYKSTYEIMQGLADLYDNIVAKDKELGTNNLNLLLETIAGKNRSNIAASILQNGDMLRSVYEDAQKSQGSAQKELDSYLDSIDGRMAQLENRAQEFWTKAIDSDAIKNGITLLTDLLELGTNIVDTFGVLPTIITGISAGLAVKNVGINTLVAY